MTNHLQRAVLCLLFLLGFGATYAQEFVVDGLKYNVSSTADATVSVRQDSGNCPVGDLTIPATVTNASTTYTVTSIDMSGFRECSGLTAVIIPGTMTTFSSNAFMDCSALTAVSIPSAVTSINSSVFSGCTNLAAVNVNWQTPLTIQANVFDGLTLSDITLTIPPGTTSAYQGTDVWKDFSPLQESLVMDANTSFFSPKGVLTLQEETTTTNVYNKNRHYERIGGWKRLNDTIVWGMKNLSVGTLTVELFAGISTGEDGSAVTVYLDDQEQDLTVNATASPQDFESQGSVSFNVSQAGTHEIKLKIKTQNTADSSFGEIKKLIASGTAITGANVWERRWRMAAVHGAFISDNDVNTEITVYEVNILSHEYESYQVMSTEFGYIGSPNSLESAGLSGLNFSLWSYGRNDAIPPHIQLSHLIAVAGEGAIFGGYGHEGTGVKPRGFDPFDTAESPHYKFTVALRKEPGELHNTFWCYYLDPVSLDWKLYSSGKKFNASGDLSYINSTGGFLEVPGPAHSQRTGHRTRVIEYRAWRMQTDRTWNVVDEIDPNYNSDTSISYKEWSQNSAGDKFIFKGGGLLDTGVDPGNIHLNNPSELPDFLQGDNINALYAMPADFETLEPASIYASQAILKFDITNLGTNPEIKLFYGTAYGLTEGVNGDAGIDVVWEESQEVSLSQINEGVLSVPVTNLTDNQLYYYRLRVKNDEGITWSYNADSFSTNGDVLSTLNAIQDDAKLIIYPNPTNGQLKFEFNSLNSEIKLYNALGQIVRSQKGGDKLSMQDLGNGIYYLEVSSPRKTKTIKVIKN